MSTSRANVFSCLSLRVTASTHIFLILEQAAQRPHSHPQPFSRQREKGASLQKISPSFVKRERADAFRFVNMGSTRRGESATHASLEHPRDQVFKSHPCSTVSKRCVNTVALHSIPPKVGAGGERSELPLTPNVKRIHLAPTLEKD